MFNKMHFKMNEMDLKKIPFFKLLNLEAVTPKNDSSKILGNNLSVSSSHNADLIYKNNSIKTGYENFYIKKGSTKLFPFKDFDFIGKHVVCQKCWQKFASKLSYKAHVGTGICVRTYNGPNLVYLKYKNRNYRQVRKKNKKKFEEDFHGHDIKKNLLNPEMLNTLQTRNKCYSDIIYQRNTVKEKPKNNSNNNDPSVKKPRGRPKKNINKVITNNVEHKKRGRPKKLKNVVKVENSTKDYNSSTKDDNSSSKDDNSSSSNMEINESEESRILSICSADDAYNNNINEHDKLKSLFSRIKSVLDKFWNFFKNQQNLNDVNCNEYQCSTQHQIKCNEEKKVELSVEEKAIFFQIGKLDNEFKFLCKRFQGNSKHSYVELELMLKKLIDMRTEYIQSKLKKTDMNKESIPDDGKENIQCTLKKNDSQREIELNNIGFDKNGECMGIWVNNNISVSHITEEMIENCKCINSTNVDNFENESTSKDNFENNLKTLTEDKTPNCTNSVNNHMNIYNPLLDCRKCSRHFASIAEWKLHRSEHMAKSNKKFLCKICGLNFKIYKNFTKHVNIHKKTEKTNCNKKNFKSLICKVCKKQYNYLRSYYAHIKTHMNE